MLTHKKQDVCQKTRVWLKIGECFLGFCIWPCRLSLLASQRPIVCGKEWQYSCKRKVSTIPGLGYTKFVINVAALQLPRNAKMNLKDVVCLLPSALLCVDKNGNILAKAKISTIILRRGYWIFVILRSFNFFSNFWFKIMVLKTTSQLTYLLLTGKWPKQFPIFPKHLIFHYCQYIQHF